MQLVFWPENLLGPCGEFSGFTSGVFSTILDQRCLGTGWLAPFDLQAI